MGKNGEHALIPWEQGLILLRSGQQNPTTTTTTRWKKEEKGKRPRQETHATMSMKEPETPGTNPGT